MVDSSVIHRGRQLFHWGLLWKEVGLRVWQAWCGLQLSSAQSFQVLGALLEVRMNNARRRIKSQSWTMLEHGVRTTFKPPFLFFPVPSSIQNPGPSTVDPQLIHGNMWGLGQIQAQHQKQDRGAKCLGIWVSIPKKTFRKMSLERWEYRSLQARELPSGNLT